VKTQGVHGPIRLYTSTHFSSANQESEMIIDDNPLFDNLKVYPAPTTITASLSRSTTDTNAKYSS